MKEFCVLIDNGHGEDTLGKCSPEQFSKRIFEWEYTRKLSKALSKELDNNGIKNIVITPENKDIPLSERVRRVNKYSNEYECILISIHLNASSRINTGTGFEVFTCESCSEKSKMLSRIFKDTFSKIVPTKKNRGSKTSNFYIIKKSKCPAILTENMFMDNEKDIEFLTSSEGFEKIVKYHLESILLYIGELSTEL